MTKTNPLVCLLIFIFFSCNDENNINNNNLQNIKVENLISTNQSSSEISLSWTNTTDNNVVGYHVYRNDILIDQTDTNNYTDTGLTAETSYTYQVRVYNSDNDTGIKSDKLTVSTKSLTNSTNNFTFSDDFEGTINNSFWLGNGVSVDYGIEDPTNTNNKVMKMSYIFNSEGNGDSWTEYDFKLPIQATEIEMSFDMFTPSNYYHFENNHKLFALWSGTYGKTNANISISSEMWGNSQGGASPSIYVGVDQNNYGHAMLSNYPLIIKDYEGRWSNYKIHLKLASDTNSHGFLEIYKDDVLITSTNHPNITKPYTNAPEASKLIHYATSGNFIDQGTILGWANGDELRNYNQDIHFFIDNFALKAN
ncbi:fibronectin type III domain-containing protein [Tenacibaculum sp. M341]|uniref:fibronectin type III domain-containing protein n=1 Tax=Tenacibaculum sp. M341 TaxID=2530339 RepID=UPI00104CA798|nr:fibronectin type III domain-containing protein [Tenacibaculum sp. M341]TCI84486.1 hypothetical protein EYW44_21315 [Tenacibaculum sp. M341]